MFIQKLFWWHCFNSYWVEALMIKKLITLFKLARKIAKSDILNIASKFKKPPLAVTMLFQLLSISESDKSASEPGAQTKGFLLPKCARGLTVEAKTVGTMLEDSHVIFN